MNINTSHYEEEHFIAYVILNMLVCSDVVIYLCE